MATSGRNVVGRAMVAAALRDGLSNVEYEKHSIFGFAIPRKCPGVPIEILNPRNTWENKNDYDKKAKYLAGLFSKNFEKYASGVSNKVLAAGPQDNS